MAPLGPDDPDLKAAIERTCAGLDDKLARLPLLDVQAELERISRRLTVVERDPGSWWARWWPGVAVGLSLPAGACIVLAGMLAASQTGITGREAGPLVLVAVLGFLICLLIAFRR